MADLSNMASRYQFGQTNWKGVLDAGVSQGDTAAAARNELLIRYHDAVYRYLIARLGDANAAGELFSQFAERVLDPSILAASRPGEGALPRLFQSGAEPNDH
jgi:hypothetical protein